MHFVISSEHYQYDFQISNLLLLTTLIPHPSLKEKIQRSRVEQFHIMFFSSKSTFNVILWLSKKHNTICSAFPFLAFRAAFIFIFYNRKYISGNPAKMNFETRARKICEIQTNISCSEQKID